MSEAGFWFTCGFAAGGAALMLYIVLCSWLGSRNPIQYEEFRDIRDEGFNDAIEAAASCLEDFVKCADNPKETARHAALIRKLKVLTVDQKTSVPT